MRCLPAALSVALALAVPLALGPAAAEAPCATPATNPGMPSAMAAETLRSYQAAELPPLALPSPVVATRELDVSFGASAVAVARPGGLRALVDEAASAGFARIACAEVAEIRGAVLCLFKDVVVGNLAFYRAATWIEGTRTAGPRRFLGDYAEYRDVLRPPARFVDGFDLTGRDLLAYRDAATAACPSDRNACLNQTETQLFERLLPRLIHQRPDVVILAAGYGKPAIVGHELLHAQYFLFAKYRAVVDCYFDRVLDDAERAEVTADLKDEYDVADPFLVRNEFQAYLLQPGETTHLPRLRATLRQELLGILREAGGFPVLPSPE
jgi:hypothetical protein